MKLHDTSIELRGTVTSHGVSVQGVHARVTLPASPFGRARMWLFPSSRQQVDQLMRSFKASFEGERPKSIGGKGKELLVCKELNMLRGTTELVSPDIERSRIVCEPVGIWHSISGDESPIPSKSHVVFRLTPNRHMGVAAVHTQNFDGSCDVIRVRQTTVDLQPGVPVHFDRHFKWATEKGSDVTVRFGFPVAVANLTGDVHDPTAIQKGLLPKLDDLLVLISLAASHRCMCVGWEVSDSTGRISRYARGGIGRPSRRPPPVLDSGLVPIAHFQNFLSSAWPVFQRSPYAEAIRSAVYAIVPLRRRTLDGQFLSMFTALEELILTFRRQTDREFILPSDKWQGVATAAKRAIKAQLIVSNTELRSMIYDNLAGLNRVPLRRATEQFLAHLNVDLTDLWPLFSGQGDGLGSIRNKLVHGDLDAAASMGSLGIAHEHLRWTLERIVLTLLGWPVESSEVRRQLLVQHAVGMQRFGEARADLARVLRRRVDVTPGG